MHSGCACQSAEALFLCGGGMWRPPCARGGGEGHAPNGASSPLLLESNTRYGWPSRRDVGDDSGLHKTSLNCGDHCPVRNKRRRPEDTSTLRPPLKLQSLVNQMMLLNHGGAQLVSEGFADHLSVERENDGLYSKHRERGGERR